MGSLARGELLRGGCRKSAVCGPRRKLFTGEYSWDAGKSVTYDLEVLVSSLPNVWTETVWGEMHLGARKDEGNEEGSQIILYQWCTVKIDLHYLLQEHCVCNRLSLSSVASVNLSNWKWKNSLEVRNQSRKWVCFGTYLREEFLFKCLPFSVIFMGVCLDLLINSVG